MVMNHSYAWGRHLKVDMLMMKVQWQPGETTGNANELGIRLNQYRVDSA
jgi:hypothetical protein